jgi:perosamine synthetase
VLGREQRRRCHYAAYESGHVGLDQELVALCETRGIALLEDAAQSLGSFHNGRHIGRMGKIASFSFSMPKIITTGQGGALITDDEDLYRKVELVKNFGRIQAGVDEHVFFGVNFKFTDLQAVVGQVQMSKVPERVPLKRQLYRTLKERLAHIRQVRFFQNSDETTPWFNDALVEDRDALIPHLKAQGVGSRSFYPPVHTQAPYNGQPGKFPVAEKLAANGLWLPSHPQMSDNNVERIVTGVESFYKDRA